MAKIFNNYDFYYGAVLSVFLSGKHTPQYTPSLISSDNKKERIYEFAVDHELDFILVMTYASHPTVDTANKNSNSWNFTFNCEQVAKIKDSMDHSKKIKIAFLCGMDKWNQSELALMDNNDIAQTIYTDGKLKTSVRIRRDKKKHSYSVFHGRVPYQLKAQLPK